jgi:Domain of unknown function (DUF4588)
MDSMRSLNTSLPPSRSRRSHAPELLQAFKSAALSVTNLYKTAVTDQVTTRQQGYQDALEDLLSFLDRENLGVQDGEGWRIRQWATERFEGTDQIGPAVESDEDRAESADTEKRARSSSPVSQQRTGHDGRDAHNISSSDDAPRPESAPPETTVAHIPFADRPPMFTFSTASPLPNQDVPMQISETTGNTQPSTEPTPEASTTQVAAPLRVEVLNRSARMQNRHAGTRHNTRNSTREMSFSGGTKRKFQLPEFFDISNLGNGRDGTNGGGKRGRFV